MILEVHHEGRYVDMFLDNTDLKWFYFPAQDLMPVPVEDAKKPPKNVKAPRESRRKPS